MNKIILIAFALAIRLSTSITSAQGTLYVSNLGAASSGSLTVGSDAWIAQAFITGPGAGGYVLDSIQLPMSASSGNPSGFSVSINNVNNQGNPESSLGSLAGSADPSADGLYTYTASDITLLPSTPYYIVLTATTPMVTGYYNANFTGNNYDSEDNWRMTALANSSNGSSWPEFSRFNKLQLAIYAMPVPEPGELGLIAFSGLVFTWYRRTVSETVSGSIR
jgi:hypothetical protein